MKTILVTGGAGFVGSHLCKKLIDNGYKVICLDNLSTGNKKNILSLIDNKYFEFIEMDIRDNRVLELNNVFDEIYNLASPASPIHYQSDPIGTTMTNVVGVNNLLLLATKYNSKILQASTSEVYGNPKIHPQTEDYFGNVNPHGIRSCYDESKRCAESLCFDYYRKYNTRIKVVRIFNTYGENMDIDDGRVISNFIVQALKEQPLTVYGNGTLTRSPMYVSDLIDGLIKMMESNDNIIGPINLGNTKEYTISEIANKVIELTKSNSNIIYKNLPSDDPLVRCPSIETAKKLLEWSPKISFENGLIKTIDYFKHIILYSKQ